MLLDLVSHTSYLSSVKEKKERGAGWDLVG